MGLNTEDITSLLTKANEESTSAAGEIGGSGKSPGKIEAVAVIFTKFLISFLKNENKSSFRDRFVYSALYSYADFLKYLKLMKLKKVI